MTDALIGKTVETVREMTDAEMEREGWHATRTHGKPSVVVFDDGTKLYASMDPEGNGPGALFGVDSEGEMFGY